MAFSMGVWLVAWACGTSLRPWPRHGRMAWAYGMGVWHGRMAWAYGIALAYDMGLWHGPMAWAYGIGL